MSFLVFLSGRHPLTVGGEGTPLKLVIPWRTRCGFSFYDHQVNVHLLPLFVVVEETKKYRRRLGYSTRSKRIVVAASPMSEKLFFLDCVDGKMLVGSKEEEMMFPCVPQDTMLDGMLHWLEEHWGRLKKVARSRFASSTK